MLWQTARAVVQCSCDNTCIPTQFANPTSLQRRLHFAGWLPPLKCCKRDTKIQSPRQTQAATVVQELSPSQSINTPPHTAESAHTGNTIGTTHLRMAAYAARRQISCIHSSSSLPYLTTQLHLVEWHHQQRRIHSSSSG